MANRIFIRRLSTGLAQQSGTSILLLHNGQPRTPFYTRKSLNLVWRNYGFPEFAGKRLTDAYWYGSRLLRKCVSDCENHKSIEETINEYISGIEVSLTSLTPEFKPVTCQAGYLFDSPSIESRIEEVIRQGTDTLILVSLYPFNLPHLTRPMFTVTNSVINKKTTTLNTFEPDPNLRVALNSPVSFKLMTLDSLGTHESIIQYWAERLRGKLENFDSVLFAVSLPMRNRKKYTSMVAETAKRIMYVLYESYPRAVPWRVGFYAPWHQFWPPVSTNTISERIKDLRKNDRTKTLVVPLGEFFPNFDTQTILPSLIEKHENTRLLPPESLDQALVHSFAEVIKTSLLQKVAQEQKIPKVKTEATMTEALL
ncbi:hypothetical protein FO519_002167 [Halicephalobus sp. NKZ332]|nr:hypothetical protein FO519_002167 [Halicephalobus sp. NKZ332]